METRRLELLAELSRLGSMRAVADALGTTTSTVSQQLAALAGELGTQLTEPDGRRVRLTPAGRLLAEHAVTILAEIEAARRDLAPGAEPTGTLRVAGFATAIRSYLLPVIAGLAATHPRIHVLIREHEPAEALQLLAADQADLALTYDYNLAPAATGPAITPSPLWTALWGLGVPAREPAGGGTAAEVFARFRAHDWIGNSRNTADEDVIRTLASMAGFTPRITHRADSLDLVQDMITAGLGVGLLPLGQPVQPGVRLLPLSGPRIELRAYAAARRGRLSWPPLALMIGLLRQASRLSPPPAARAAGAAVAAAGAARFALTARAQKPAPASPAAVSADRRHA
jgi:DNA-binding transcriptional LysR family regulator